MGNYYLSASGPLGTGDGTSATNAADASTQAKLDAIWASFVGKAVNFFYAAGLYQTKGWAFQTRETFQNNQGHFGAGMNSTTIQLVGSSSLTGDGIIFSMDGTGTVFNWACKDMTLDCNATAQPKWSGAGGKATAIIFNAGSNVTIQRVKFINWGTVTSGVECFVCCLIPVTGQKNILIENILFDSCVFTSPAFGNHDGVSCSAIGDMAGSNVLCDKGTCIISNCTFTNCFSKTAGQPGDFLYQHCYGAPTCIFNTATNCDVGFYIEPAGVVFPNMQIRVENNTLTNANFGVLALMHNGARMAGINVNGDNYVLNSTGTGVRIEGSGGAIASSAALTVQNLTVMNGTGVIISDGGLMDLFVQVVYIINCTFSGTPTNINMALIGEFHNIPPITVNQNGVYVVVSDTGAKIVADLVTGVSYYGELLSVSSGPYASYTAAITALINSFYP